MNEIPTGLTATWDSEHKAIKLTWDNNAEVNSPNFSYYFVHRKTIFSMNPQTGKPEVYTWREGVAQTRDTTFFDTLFDKDRSGIGYAYCITAVYRGAFYGLGANYESKPCPEVLVEPMREEQ